MNAMRKIIEKTNNLENLEDQNNNTSTNISENTTAETTTTYVESIAAYNSADAEREAEFAPYYTNESSTSSNSEPQKLDKGKEKADIDGDDFTSTSGVTETQSFVNDSD